MKQMTTESKTEESTTRAREKGVSQWAVGWMRFKRNKAGLIGLGMIMGLIVIAVLHNVIAPYPARPAIDAFKPLYEGEAAMPPSAKHLFGTTVMGTDVFSEVIHASVYTLYVAISVTFIVMLLTVLVGITAGYIGKYVDDTLMRTAEVFLVFPSTLLILVFARVFQLAVAEPYWEFIGIQIPVGLTIIVFIVSVFGWASNARVIRGEVLRIKEFEYIDAAKSLGASSRWIMFRHIFPNILPQIIVLATLTMASSVLVEAGVSFLGFGDPNTVTWGRILQENFNDLSTTWWAEIYPGLAVFFTTLAFNLVGDALSDALNPRLRE
jgi:ABC-type dipeptide/oligopeptide/nickel transport system permease subunit